MDGYELNVVDYLLKPIAMHRLLQAAEKVVERLSAQNENVVSEKKAELTFMFAKYENKLVRIDFADILYIEGMQNFVKIHTVAKSYLISQTMKAMEEILPSVSFVRVHKSFIVAMNAIHSVYGNTIEIGALQIPIGSNFKADFMGRIER